SDPLGRHHGVILEPGRRRTGSARALSGSRQALLTLVQLGATVEHMLPSHVEIFIIGAGFGGRGAAIKLQEAGERDFLCIDRGSEVGGTWRDNSYPGAACDVPSQL